MSQTTDLYHKPKSLPPGSPFRAQRRSFKNPQQITLPLPIRKQHKAKQSQSCTPSQNRSLLRGLICREENYYLLEKVVMCESQGESGETCGDSAGCYSWCWLWRASDTFGCFIRHSFDFRPMELSWKETLLILTNYSWALFFPWMVRSQGAPWFGSSSLSHALLFLTQMFFLL